MLSEVGGVSQLLSNTHAFVQKVCHSLPTMLCAVACAACVVFTEAGFDAAAACWWIAGGITLGLRWV